MTLEEASIEELRTEVRNRERQHAERRRREVQTKKQAIKEATGANAFWSSDYAGADIGELRFYYGYEVTTGDDEWCFEVSRGDETLFTKPWYELSVDKFDVMINLLMGLMVWIGDQDEDS